MTRTWLNGTHIGDCRTLLKEMARDGVRVQTVVTSPPYWGLRDYGTPGQIGLERTPLRFVARIRTVFRLVWDVLEDNGTVWLNLGDCYANDGKWGGETGGLQSYLPDSDRKRCGREKRRTGLKPKDLVGIPWRVAFALQADGWWLRNDCIWHKPNPMPESVQDRCTKSHEYMFLLSKSQTYYFDRAAIIEPAAPDTDGRYGRAHGGYAPPGQKPHGGILAPRVSRSGNVDRKPRPGPDGNGKNQMGNVPWEGSTRNKRTVWTVPTRGYDSEHFATFPADLITPCILAGAPAGGIVLDPFMGSGTTAQVATGLGRQYIGCEINPEYAPLHEARRTTIGLAI